MTHQFRLAGFFTRAVALVLDAAIVTVATTLIGFCVALVLGLFKVRITTTPLREGLDTGGWLVIVGIYFVWFWTLAGQTPGMRFMGIGVIATDGGKPTRGQALRRLIGMFLSALPAGAGFLLVLIDDQRRGLHDLIGSTLVVHDPRRGFSGVSQKSWAQTRRPGEASQPLGGLTTVRLRSTHPRFVRTAS